MAIVGKMDPQQFAKFQAEYRAKMAAIAAKRDGTARAALEARLTEAARVAGSYRPFATVAQKVATELREEFAKAEPIVATGRSHGKFVSRATYAEARVTAIKLAMLGYGE